MPVRRRWLDPMTRDYVLVSGGMQGDSTRTQKVLLRIFTRKGSIALAGLEFLGSKLHTLQKATSSAARVGVGYVFDALDDMIKSREIYNVECTADVVVVDGTTALSFVLSFHDDGDGDVRQVRWNRSFASRTGA